MQRDNRVRVLEQPYNQFAGAARNRGIDEARGKYLIFWDADDFFEPDALERMYLQSELHSAEICVCGARVYDMRTKRLVSANHCLDLKFLPLELPFSSRSYPENAFSFTSPGPFNKLFLKEFIMRECLQFSHLPRCEDLPFVLLSIALANRITAVDRILINYRRGTATSSQETISESPFSFYEALQELRQGLINYGLFQQFEKAFVITSLNNCLYNLSLQKTKELWLSVALRLKNEILEVLGCTQCSKSLFPNQGQYDRMMFLLETSPEDLAAYEPELRLDESHFEVQQRQGKNANSHMESLEDEYPLKPGETIKVSVVIPVYNTENYLEECLRSVMRQTLQEIEIICVDDGSTDSSMLILERLQKEDNRIQIFRQENRGVSVARNSGMSKARGDYIYFPDSDDYLAWCALEHMYREAKKDNLDQLFFEAEAFFDPIELYKDFSSHRTYYHYKQDYGAASNGKDLFIRLREEPREFKPSGCAQLLRRAFLEENGITFYPGILHEDNLFTLQCLMLAKRAKVVREPLYMRRLRPSSIITSEKTWNNAYGILTCIYESGKSATKLGIDNNDFIEALSHCQMIIGWQAIKALRDITCEDIKSNIAELPLEKRYDYMLLIKNIQRQGSLQEQNEALNKRASDLRIQVNLTEKRMKEVNKRAESAEKQVKSAEARTENAEKRAEKADRLIESEKKKVASLEKRLSKLKNSRSYRLGRFLTSPVRLVRKLSK